MTTCTSELRRAKYAERIRSRHVHEIVRLVEQEMFDRRLNRKDVSSRAGLGHNAIEQWIYGHSPSIANIEAVLQVLGYRLTVSPIDDTKHE